MNRIHDNWKINVNNLGPALPLSWRSQRSMNFSCWSSWIASEPAAAATGGTSHLQFGTNWRLGFDLAVSTLKSESLLVNSEPPSRWHKQSMMKFVANTFIDSLLHFYRFAVAALFQTDPSRRSWNICSLAPPEVGCFLVGCFSFYSFALLIWSASQNVQTCNWRPRRGVYSIIRLEPAPPRFFPPIVWRSLAPSCTSSI